MTQALPRNKKDSAETLIEGLRLFDEENTGLIPACRFRQLLTQLGSLNGSREYSYRKIL
jgi:Ca2+-binding EF-hand superfamily protein